MTVKAIKEFLNSLNDDEVLYVGYADEDNETEFGCSLWTDKAIIRKANDYNLEHKKDKVNDIETALEVCSYYDETYHYMKIEV